MQNMNVVEMVGAVFAGLITVAIAATIFKPNSTAPAFVSSLGSSFATAVKGAKA